MDNSTDELRASQLRFLAIDERTGVALREFWTAVEPELPRVLDGFYRHLATLGQLAGMVGRQVPRLKQAQTTHWRRLFAGGFDDEYFASVRTIGLVHNRVGLEPSWYIGGYAFVMTELLALAVRASRWRGAHLAYLLGAINRAVMLDMVVAIAVYQEAMLADRARRVNAVDEAVKSFGGDVDTILATVTSAAASLKTTAETLAADAADASRQTVAVSAASEEASSNVQTVASAAEQLAGSIAEIGRQVAESTRTTRRAVDEANQTHALVTTLADAAQRIGEVVKLINDIAGRTNLLALNATIEAARAGEAGKGFAVVASEVKSLATQTARATDDIAAQVGAIQDATSRAVAAIDAIRTTIAGVSEISTTIAAAVEEQDAATKEIARNVQQAAAGTGEVNRNIAGLNGTATRTGDAAGSVLAAARSLGGEAGALNQRVAGFFEQVRAA